MRIALVNSVILNGGDAGIVFGICDAIYKMIPEVKMIAVFVHEKKNASPHYPDLTLRPMLQDYWQRYRQLDRLMRWSYPLRSKVGVTFLAERAFLHELATYDLIIYCGGGYINDLYSTSVLYRIMQQTLECGVPHMAYAHSIGPFFCRESEQEMARLLSQFLVVTTRDRNSFDMLQRLGVEPKVLELTADAAFAMRVHNISELNEAEQAVVDMIMDFKSHHSFPMLFMSVRPWGFPGRPEASKLATKYHDELVRFVWKLLEETDWSICFFSTCQGRTGYGIDDAAFAYSILSKVPDQLLFTDRTIVIDSSFHPRSYPCLIASCADVVISMRMHFVIYSVLSGVPVIPIAYEQKTRELVSQIGIEDYCLNVEELDAEDLMRVLCHLQGNVQNIKACITSGRDKLWERSLDNARVLRKALRLPQLDT